MATLPGVRRAGVGVRWDVVGMRGVSGGWTPGWFRRIFSIKSMDCWVRFFD